MNKSILLASFYLQDLKYKLGVRFIAYMLVAAYFPLRAIRKPLAYKILLASHRANYNKLAAWLIRRNLSSLANLIKETQSRPNGQQQRHIAGRSIVLKQPIKKGPIVKEKGILLIKFTETFAYFLRYVDCRRLLSDYHVVLEPSWTGQAIEEVLGWTKYEPYTIYVQTADEMDFQFIAGLKSNLVPIKTGAGDYVDYRIFKPLGQKKEYDCVCIANYCSHKRLHAYIMAVKKLAKGNPKAKAALVCASMGPLRSKIHRFIEVMGASEHIDVIEGCNQVRLNEVIDRSRVNLLVSYREGASKVLSESLFTDVPSIVLRENLGVNKAHFNMETGMVVSEKDLPAAIASLSAESQAFSPRAWALENIAPEVTMSKIAAAICQHERDGMEFSGKVFAKVNVPEARYMRDYAEMSEEKSQAIVGSYIYDFGLPAEDGVQDAGEKRAGATIA